MNVYYGKCAQASLIPELPNPIFLQTYLPPSRPKLGTWETKLKCKARSSGMGVENGQHQQHAHHHWSHLWHFLPWLGLASGGSSSLSLALCPWPSFCPWIRVACPAWPCRPSAVWRFVASPLWWERSVKCTVGWKLAFNKGKVSFLIAPKDELWWSAGSFILYLIRCKHNFRWPHFSLMKDRLICYRKTLWAVKKAAGKYPWPVAKSAAEGALLKHHRLHT